MIPYRTTADRKEGEQLEDRRNVGESSCNFGDETDQRVQSLMFMMMMMMMKIIDVGIFLFFISLKYLFPFILYQAVL
jgi:hypothetical protein